MTTLNAEYMRAAFIRETGPAESIVVGDVPIARPGPGSVLVHNSVMAVNHVDTFIRSGAYATTRPGGAGEPFIVGRDLAGVVASVGAGVTGFAVGDAVWSNSLGYGGRQGSFSEFSLVPADLLYPVPAGVTPESVVSVAHTGATAYLGLVREAGLRIGETVFIGGAAGGVGSAAVQLARAAGARVLASCAPHDAEWVRACGADEVFDRTDTAMLDRVYASTPDGIDVWWDTTGRLDLAAALPLVRRGGRVLLTVGMSGAGVTISPGELVTRDIQLRGFALSNASVADLAEAASSLNGVLARGGFKSRVAKVLSLEDAAGAHRLMESHAAPGKLLVKPGSARPKPHVPGSRVGTAGSTGAAGSADAAAGAAAKPGVTAKPGMAAGPGAAAKPGPVASTTAKPGAAAKPHAPVAQRTDPAPKPGSVGEHAQPASADAAPAPAAKPHPTVPQMSASGTTDTAGTTSKPSPKPGPKLSS